MSPALDCMKKSNILTVLITGIYLRVGMVVFCGSLWEGRNSNVPMTHDDVAQHAWVLERISSSRLRLTLGLVSMARGKHCQTGTGEREILDTSHSPRLSGKVTALVVQIVLVEGRS
ncbi:Hypothetical predicted protein [Podarcis lilfordi]|uniref:Uncharacterized protein n=1 Tax=Podarcis lilfordi TaxID=74358 RepID=A0AA35JV42_9SAUR|nr:Hypothetical predicted protein [Podarcis lilfordi]